MEDLSGYFIEASKTMATLGLLSAAKKGNLTDLRRYIVEGTDINSKDVNGNTALILATKYGHCELADFLVASGADSLLKGGLGMIPLHFAVLSKCSVCTAMLISEKISAVNVTDHFNRTALHHAARAGFLDGLNQLIEKGAVMRQDSLERTALHFAAMEGKPEAIKVILRLPDCKVNQEDSRGKTALDYGNSECGEVLVLRGARRGLNSNSQSTPSTDHQRLKYPPHRSYLYNNLSNINFMELSSKSKPKVTKILSELGHQGGSGNLKDAACTFMQREFREICDRAKHPHPVMFVPSVYVYQSAKERPIVNSALEDHHPERLNTLDGNEVEKKVFDKLRSALKNEKNTLVLSGWNNKNAKANGSHLEADFIIICEPFHVIVSIEVKKACKEKSKRKSGDQLIKQRSIFKNHIPFHQKDKWVHYEAIYFDMNEQSGDTKWMTLWKNTDLATWWRAMTLDSLVQKGHSDSYEDAAKFFLFQMHLQGERYSDAGLATYGNEKVNELSEPPLLLKYTKVQYELLENRDARKVALTSLFGTGKTILLIAKAKELEKKAEHNEKIIFFVVEKNEGDSLLKKKLSQNNSLINLDSFLERKAPTVKQDRESSKSSEEKYLIQVEGLQENMFRTRLEDLRKSNNPVHFFLDEVPITQDISLNFINEFAAKLTENQTFWIAFQSQSNVDPLKLNGFLTPEMIVPFRYTASTLAVCSAIKMKIGEGDTRFPNIKADLMTNLGAPAQLLAVTKEVGLSNCADVVATLMKSYEKEIFNRIIKVEIYKEDYKNEFRKYGSKIVFDDEEELVDFTSEEDKKLMLVITDKSEKFLLGYEVPSVTLITPNITGIHVENILSRCKASLTLVSNAEDLGRIHSEAENYSKLKPLEKNECHYCPKVGFGMLVNHKDIINISVKDPVVTDEMVEDLRTQEIQSYQNQLKRLRGHRNFENEGNHILTKLAATIEDDETYLFSKAQLSEDIKTDFFIISRSARLITTIVMDEAASDNLKYKLGKVLSDCTLETEYKWRHLNVIYIKDWLGNERLGCACCRLGLIGPKSDLSRWWKDVRETSWKNIGTEDGFVPLIKFLAKNIFKKRGQITSEKPFWSGEELFWNSLFL